MASVARVAVAVVADAAGVVVNDEGLAGSISDELGPTQTSEASDAVADLEGQDTRHDAQPHQYAASDTVTSYAAPQPKAEQSRHNAVPMFAPGRA